jgi:hypothetical protein
MPGTPYQQTASGARHQAGGMGPAYRRRASAVLRRTGSAPAEAGDTGAGASGRHARGAIMPD